jgi:hypothetical protein
MSGSGDDAIILEYKNAEGDVYTNCDRAGNPHNVRFADGGTGFHLQRRQHGAVGSLRRFIDADERSGRRHHSRHKNAEATSAPTTTRPKTRTTFLADGSTGVFTYNAGTVRLDLSDGSSTLMSGPGDDAVILSKNVG